MNTFVSEICQTSTVLLSFPMKFWFYFVIQVLIVEGETGSGKTTQIPQYLYEAVSFPVQFTFQN